MVSVDEAVEDGDEDVLAESSEVVDASIAACRVPSGSQDGMFVSPAGPY
jgi:hypothetical protein